MSDSVLITGLVALGFAFVHVFGRAMRFLQVTPRSIWLSISGGVSLAYVFVHLLPELAQRQEESLRHLGRSGESLLALHVYLTALLGLVLFYGLDRLVRQARRGARAQTVSQDGKADGIFWVHLASYGLYSVLIGYLLVHREETDARGLVIYAIALGLHFVVNDQGLREYHGQAYDRKGRWILAAAPVLGWLAGIVFAVSPVVVASIFAFLAGCIVLNVLKEELPEDRESRFWALGAGALGFAALLVAAR